MNCRAMVAETESELKFLIAFRSLAPAFQKALPPMMQRMIEGVPMRDNLRRYFLDAGLLDQDAERETDRALIAMKAAP